MIDQHRPRKGQQKKPRWTDHYISRLPRPERGDADVVQLAFEHVESVPMKKYDAGARGHRSERTPLTWRARRRRRPERRVNDVEIVVFFGGGGGHTYILASAESTSPHVSSPTSHPPTGCDACCLGRNLAL